MKVRFIEECAQDNILMETENFDGLSAIFAKYAQIEIETEEEILSCIYEYNVLKVLKNEIDIYVTIDGTSKID